MKEIDYNLLIENLESMVNVLEYDSMRSQGKAKLNSQHLHSMLYLIDAYKSRMVKVSKEK